VSGEEGDDDDDELDDEDLADFIDDSTPTSSSQKLHLPGPGLDRNENLPVFQHIFD
jgi:hypothetical protein